MLKERGAKWKNRRKYSKKGLSVMAGLIPFNKNKISLGKTGFQDFYNMLDDFFKDTWPPQRNLLNDTFKIDIQEKETEYSIEAELPGVKKEEITIELKDGRLSILVDREEKIEEEKKNYIHKERHYSSMQRSIYLENAQADDVKAKLDGGVLSITVPKIEKIENKAKIEIE